MSVLDVILVILLVAWLGGYGFNIGGNIIHVLLVVALVVLVMRLLGVGHVSA
ncbi:MAG: lmo0937 family membrane protein [Patescibacteria group bacterium]